MGIFSNLFENKNDDFQDKIVNDTFKNLEVVSVIQKISPIGIDGTISNVHKRRPTLYETFRPIKLPGNGYETGGNFFYSITCKEYENDFNLWFKFQSSCYFIFEIKPHDEKLRTVMFLLASYSSQNELFQEVGTRAHGGPDTYFHHDTHELLKKCYVKAVNYYLENYSGKDIDEKFKNIVWENNETKTQEIEKNYPKIEKKELLDDFSILEVKTRM